jgi:16S rRNA (guanine(966)-N(2))-methyltransferase RsmD
MESRRPPSSRNIGQRPRRATNGHPRSDRQGYDGPSGNRFARSSGETRGNTASSGSSWQPKRRDHRSDPRKFGNAQKTRPRPAKRWQNNDGIKITSDLQVTDGKFKGQTLSPVPSPKIVPTPRKLREAVYRVLGRRIRAAKILDICTGNGSIGFEALSRGAMSVTYVERSVKSCSVIKKNLETCGIRDGRCDVLPLEALAFLAQTKKQRKFWDVVYFGPPYNIEYDAYLKHFGNGVSIRPGGVLMIEHSTDINFPETVGLLTKKRVIVQNDAAVSFFERR